MAQLVRKSGIKADEDIKKRIQTKMNPIEDKRANHNFTQEGKDPEKSSQTGRTKTEKTP